MTRSRIASALVSGLLLALAFPAASISGLAWIALVPLLLASLGASNGAAFLCGFLQGMVFYILTLTWIYSFLRTFGGLPVLVAAGLLALLAASLSFFTGVFSLGLACLDRSSRALAFFAAPFLWVALELTRTHFPILECPWNLLGYAISERLGLVQLVSWTGIYGLSFLVLGYNVLLAWLMEARTHRAAVAWVAATAVLLAVLIFGPRFVPVVQGRYVARLVQLDIPVSASYAPNWTGTHKPELEELARLSEDGTGPPPGLIVWPEAPAPFSLQDAQFAGLAERIARNSRADFLVGVDDWRTGPQGTLVPYNSAALLDSGGQRVFLYDKIHLVPLGEYVPLRRWLTFARKLTGEIGDYRPGWSYKVGTLPGGRFSVFICYEAIFPAEVRRFVAGGAELLVNVSDDGWYGRSAGPLQHLAMARVRAVENRRWLLRDTNTGYTVAVDPYGRIVARLAPFTRAAVDASYDFRSDRTLYARWGDWWAWLCVVVAAASLLGKGRTRKA